MQKTGRNPRKGRIRTGVRILSTEVLDSCPRSLRPGDPRLANAPPPRSSPPPRARGSGTPAALGAPAQVTAVDLVPAADRQPASSSARTALHARRHPLARLRKRHVPHALARGALERMAAGGAGGRGRPGPRFSREPDTERVAARKPVVGRAVRPGSRCAREGGSREFARSSYGAQSSAFPSGLRLRR